MAIAHPEQKFHILYLFSLHITCIQNDFIQTCHKHFLLFLIDTGHEMTVVNFERFSLAVGCIFVICHKKLSILRMIL